MPLALLDALGKPAPLDATQIKTALQWRGTFAAIERGDFTGLDAGGLLPGADPADVARFVAATAVEDAADDMPPAAGRAFAGIARGTATPLSLHVDAWLAEGGAKGPLNVRTKAMHRADVDVVAAWLAKAGISTVEAVTPATAGCYVTEQLIGRGVHPATANRRVTAIASY